MASGSRNYLLASFSPADFALLEPHLEPVTLGLRKHLERVKTLPCGTGKDSRKALPNRTGFPRPSTAGCWADNARGELYETVQ
jgi:hypothetical protein